MMDHIAQNNVLDLTSLRHSSTHIRTTQSRHIFSKEYVIKLIIALALELMAIAWF